MFLKSIYGTLYLEAVCNINTGRLSHSLSYPSFLIPNGPMKPDGPLTQQTRFFLYFFSPPWAICGILELGHCSENTESWSPVCQGMPQCTWFWMAVGSSTHSSTHKDNGLPAFGVSSSVAVGWVAVPECIVRLTVQPQLTKWLLCRDWEFILACRFPYAHFKMR